VGAQVGDVTLAARRPPTNDILDGARIEDATLPDSSSNDRGGHQIDRHQRIRSDMLGASAAASHDSGQASGVQEHRGKRKGHEGGSDVQQGEGKRAKGDKDTTTSRTSESGKRDDTGSEGDQGDGKRDEVGKDATKSVTLGGTEGEQLRAPERKRKAKKKNKSPSYLLYKKQRDNRGASR
jgi:hypothetical protein